MFSLEEISNITTKCMNDFLENRPQASDLLMRLSTIGNLVLFGGAVRDALASQDPRDIDIVVDGKPSAIDQVLCNFVSTKNRFGGYSVSLEGNKYDIWSLESTWAFRERLVQNVSIDNLVETVFLNIDSVAVNLSTGDAYANRFLDALNTNVLDIVLSENPFPPLCVVRALVLKNKRSLSYSNALMKYILAWLMTTSDPCSELMAVQLKHYGSLVLSDVMIRKELKEIMYGLTDAVPGSVTVSSNVSVK